MNDKTFSDIYCHHRRTYRSGTGIRAINGWIIIVPDGAEQPVGTMLAMVGGAAIFSLALEVWLVRVREENSITMKTLLFYNAAVSFILLYGVLKMGFGGFVLWGVIGFHICQTAICFRILQKKMTVNSS